MELAKRWGSGTRKHCVQFSVPGAVGSTLTIGSRDCTWSHNLGFPQFGGRGNVQKVEAQAGLDIYLASMLTMRHRAQKRPLREMALDQGVLHSKGMLFKRM